VAPTRAGKGVGFVANGIDLWRRVFVSTRAYVSEFLSWMAERTERAANQMIRIMNRIPGVKAEIDPFIGNFADEMGREARKARKQANEAWNRPLPSDKIDKYFKTLNANVAKSRKEFEKAAELRERMKNAGTSGLFNFDLGGLVNRASQTIQKLAKDMQISAVQTVRLEAPPSVEKGSRDLYRLIADSQRRNLDQMKPAKINNERDRRILNGVTIPVTGIASKVAMQGRPQDLDHVMGLGIAAFARISMGDTSTITVFRDKLNVSHNMIPHQVFEMWQVSAGWVSAVYSASWALKDLERLYEQDIPHDYFENRYWPPSEL